MHMRDGEFCIALCKRDRFFPGINPRAMFNVPTPPAHANDDKAGDEDRCACERGKRCDCYPDD